MTTHRFTPTHYHTTIGSHEPVLRIAPGDTVITTTVDAAGSDARNEQVTPGGNPRTGPFFIESAEPGDTLVVRFDRLTPYRDTGFTHTVIAPRIVDPEVVHGLPEEAAAAANIRIAFLPFRTPELMPCEDLWRLVKAVVAANRVYQDVQEQAERAVTWLATRSPYERLLKTGLFGLTFQWLST